MQKSFAHAAGSNFSFDPNDEILESIFKQYERVIVESLVTSFGLDFIIKDRHGGDVDTIHNVRKMKKDKDHDPKMAYKNPKNARDYATRGIYDSTAYHNQNKAYRNKRTLSKSSQASGNHIDAYTQENISQNEDMHIDHTISAKDIHDDRGRVLAGLKGTDLANSEENLHATNRHLNILKNDNTMEEFLTNEGKNYTEAQKSNMREIDRKARESYESKVAKAYYTSPKFAKDLALSAGSVGLKMGLRQVLGFVFAEIWFAVKEEFSQIAESFDLEKLFQAIGNGVKQGFKNAKTKYKDLLTRFQDGALAGMFSSLTTTLINTFSTTAKNVVKIIRQTYVFIVQAAKILFINPENLLLGDRICAVVKILSVGASIVVGTTVSEAIGTTAIAKIPIIGEVVQAFCGTLTTGIMSCSLLYFFDRSSIVKQLVSPLNSLPTVNSEVNYFRQQAEYFEQYAAQLEGIDLKKFKEEVNLYNSVATMIDDARDEAKLNEALKNALDVIGVRIPWEGSFDNFMIGENPLVFE